MADIGVRGAPAPQAIGGRRISPLQIGEIVLIAILLIATAAFGYQWNQARSDYNTAQGRTTSAQKQLAAAQAELTAQKQLTQYTGIYLSGTSAINEALSGVSNALDNGDYRTAQTELSRAQAAVTDLQNRISGLVVPASLTAADSEFHQGLDLMSSAMTAMRQALANDDYATAIKSQALMDQALTHFNNGEAMLWKALGVPGGGSTSG